MSIHNDFNDNESARSAFFINLQYDPTKSMMYKFKNNQKSYNLIYVVSDISGSGMRGTFSSFKAMKIYIKDLTIDQYNTYTDNGSKKVILVVSDGSYDNIKEHFSTWNHEDFHSCTEAFGLFPNKNIKNEEDHEKYFGLYQ
ncbi:hypothetical protein [Flammeovirga kamogawensis]|uniref:VWA domain-containing protein n=1 Tax=Flammeovirga kamogawensis TaxID=373891 RepID=A0ABX8H2M6_9BACT|nr:hypothetical protein [Flammeovirga kamogawensis]MBB6460355.1 hypothetical protein [Flammeovirga kamogawensis]QWG10164.1 hypothetical protein KM029_21000 [Flammeovirga kamogawensis]TRX64616.1 hypothetical protein EO216_18930 [Flammeovirga kamogawensis]